MLLTDLSSAPAYKNLQKCRCKKSVKLNGHVFSISEKFNFAKIDNIHIEIYTGLETKISIKDVDFNMYFSVIN